MFSINVVVVVALLFHVHGKHLRSCRDSHKRCYIFTMRKYVVLYDQDLQQTEGHTFGIWSVSYYFETIAYFRFFTLKYDNFQRSKTDTKNVNLNYKIVLT